MDVALTDATWSPVGIAGAVMVKSNLALLETAGPLIVSMYSTNLKKWSVFLSGAQKWAFSQWFVDYLLAMKYFSEGTSRCGHEGRWIRRSPRAPFESFVLTVVLHCFVKKLLKHFRDTFNKLWSKSCVFQNEAKIMWTCAEVALNNLFWALFWPFALGL